MKVFVRRALLTLFGLLLLGGLIYSFLPRPIGVDLVTVRRCDLIVVPSVEEMLDLKAITQ